MTGKRPPRLGWATLCCGGPRAVPPDLRGPVSSPGADALHTGSVKENGEGQHQPLYDTAAIASVTTNPSSPPASTATSPAVAPAPEQQLAQESTQLAALLAKLAGIHGSWLSRLQGTAAALQHALRADLVAITALGGGGSEYVCLAAEGIGVPHMDVGIPQLLPYSLPWDTGSCAGDDGTPACSMHHVLGREASLNGCVFDPPPPRLASRMQSRHLPSGLQSESQGAPVTHVPGSHLPQDWQQLYRTYGLNTFTAYPILCGQQLAGALTVAWAAPRPSSTSLATLPPGQDASGTGPNPQLGYGGLQDSGGTGPIIGISAPSSPAHSSRYYTGGSRLHATPGVSRHQLPVIAAFLGGFLFQGPEVGMVCSYLQDLNQLEDVDSLVKCLSRIVISFTKAQLHLTPQCRVAVVRGDGLSAAVFEEIGAVAGHSGASRHVSAASYVASHAGSDDFRGLDDFSPLMQAASREVAGEHALRRTRNPSARVDLPPRTSPLSQGNNGAISPASTVLSVPAVAPPSPARMASPSAANITHQHSQAQGGGHGGDGHSKPGPMTGPSATGLPQLVAGKHVLHTIPSESGFSSIVRTSTGSGVPAAGSGSSSTHQTAALLLGPSHTGTAATGASSSMERGSTARANSMGHDSNRPMSVITGPRPASVVGTVDREAFPAAGSTQAAPPPRQVRATPRVPQIPSQPSSQAPTQPPSPVHHQQGQQQQQQSLQQPQPSQQDSSQQSVPPPASTRTGLTASSHSPSMAATPMLLSNTLLGQAIHRHAGVWVADCTLWVNNGSNKASRDVFIGRKNVASLAVTAAFTPGPTRFSIADGRSEHLFNRSMSTVTGSHPTGPESLAAPVSQRPSSRASPRGTLTSALTNPSHQLLPHYQSTGNGTATTLEHGLGHAPLMGPADAGMLLPGTTAGMATPSVLTESDVTILQPTRSSRLPASPLLGVYIIFSTALPAQLLKAIINQVDTLLQALVPLVHHKLSGCMRDEYEYLTHVCLDPQALGARSGQLPGNQAQDAATPSAATPLQITPSTSGQNGNHLLTPAGSRGAEGLQLPGWAAAALRGALPAGSHHKQQQQSQGHQQQGGVPPGLGNVGTRVSWGEPVGVPANGGAQPQAPRMPAILHYPMQGGLVKNRSGTYDRASAGGNAPVSGQPRHTASFGGDRKSAAPHLSTPLSMHTSGELPVSRLSQSGLRVAATGPGHLSPQRVTSPRYMISSLEGEGVISLGGAPIPDPPSTPSMPGAQRSQQRPWEEEQQVQEAAQQQATPQRISLVVDGMLEHGSQQLPRAAVPGDDRVLAPAGALQHPHQEHQTRQPALGVAAVAEPNAGVAALQGGEDRSSRKSLRKVISAPSKRNPGGLEQGLPALAPYTPPAAQTPQSGRPPLQAQGSERASPRHVDRVTRQPPPVILTPDPSQPDAPGHSTAAANGREDGEGQADKQHTTNALAGQGGAGGHHTRKTASFVLLESDNSMTSPMKTNALLAGLHDKLRSMQARLMHSNAQERLDDLQGVELLEEIGAGGYGRVYRGLYNGVECAVKVTQGRAGEADLQALRDAFELAVMSSISHPSLVNIITFFTDVSVVKPLPGLLGPSAVGLGGSGALGHSSSLVLVPSSQVSESEAAAHRTVACIMELCDGGSLLDAIRQGAFKTAVKGGYGASTPNYPAIYTTLLEVAMALRHLHSLHLVHCDLKPSNVLLKSSSRDPRGFTCKLSDFGLVKLMVEDPTTGRLVIGREKNTGTLTHMAPELLIPDALADASVDVYSFGIVMYEMIASAPLSLGLDGQAICDRVLQGMRPELPAHIDSSYRALAQSCWAADPGSRPTSSDLVSAVRKLLVQSGSLATTKARRFSSALPGSAVPGGVAGGKVPLGEGPAITPSWIQTYKQANNHQHMDSSALAAIAAMAGLDKPVSPLLHYAQLHPDAVLPAFPPPPPAVQPTPMAATAAPVAVPAVPRQGGGQGMWVPGQVAATGGGQNSNSGGRSHRSRSLSVDAFTFPVHIL